MIGEGGEKRGEGEVNEIIKRCGPDGHLVLREKERLKTGENGDAGVCLLQKRMTCKKVQLGGFAGVCGGKGK